MLAIALDDVAKKRIFVVGVARVSLFSHEMFWLLLVVGRVVVRRTPEWIPDSTWEFVAAFGRCHCSLSVWL